MTRKSRMRKRFAKLPYATMAVRVSSLAWITSVLRTSV